MCVINRPFCCLPPPPSFYPGTFTSMVHATTSTTSIAGCSLKSKFCAALAPPPPPSPPSVEHHDEERALKKKKDGRSPLSFSPQSASFRPLLFNGARHGVLALLQILLSPSDSLTWKKPSGTGSLWDKRRTSTCLLAAAHPRASQHLSSLSLRNPIKHVVHKMINTDFISPHVIISRSARLIELALLVLVGV